jgi:predicted metal-binding membrane protein
MLSENSHDDRNLRRRQLRPLTWIAALTLIVIIEKLASHGRTFGNFTAVLLTMWPS